MGTLLNSESRRLYSWWWDSHVSPKNSKWLQDNLTDMDGKVKAMIKLIEEDADSFARRAEMYYKKRPELMKLVEEFYRAYRALAERYNHATGELRQAHRTMAQAFPDLVLGDETPSNSDPDTPKTPHVIRAFFDSDQFQGHSGSNSPASKRFGAFSDEPEKGMTKRGLKQVNDMSFGDGKVREKNPEGDIDDLLKDNQKLKGRVVSESERASKAESELQAFREALAKIEAEKEAILVLYQQSLEKLSTLEKSLDQAETDSRVLNDQACEAKAEIRALRDALGKLEAERDVSLRQCERSQEKLAAAEENAKRLSERAMKEENECKHLNQELDRLKAEKEVAELHYQQLLDKVASLEKKLALSEETLKMIGERCEKAEKEVEMLKDEVRKLTEERDTMALQYKLCLETIFKLRHELDEVLEDNGRLNSKILSGSEKLKGAEDQCVLLGKLNESLQLEARDLSQKIAEADQELLRKQSELERLSVSLKDERSRFSQVEATLQTLQKLHSESQEERRALALELQNGVQKMKDLEISKRDLQVEIQQLKDENRTLNDLNLSSSISQKNLEDEMLNIKEMKQKLEAEVKHQAEQSDALQLQVQVLKAEIDGLYRRYRALMQEVESLDLNPESFGSSVRGLQDENQQLKEALTKDKADREALIEKLMDMEEQLKKNATLESSLFEVNMELRRSKEKAEALQEDFGNLKEEKSTLVVERAALLSQLQIITETMQNLLEKNATLQTSLCGATAELEGLRAKSTGLEELCQLLRSEKAGLLAERSSLASRLEIVEKKLEYLDTRFTNLEEKYAGLEKEKQATINQVQELRVSLDVEKQERTSLVLTSEARLSGLEGRIHDLQKENKYRKVEFEEQLEKAVNAQVEIFILQKFVKDMEEKNFSLLIECQRQAEAAKYSEELITELESENMIQQEEAEILLDKIGRLKDGIHRVLKALEIENDGEKEKDGNFIPHALEKIRNIKSSLSESKDENQQLLIEKSILSSILQDLYSDCEELSSKKTTLERETLLLTENLVKLEDEKQDILERSRQLNLKLAEGEIRGEVLKSEVQNLIAKQVELQGSYLSLKEENLEAFEQKKCLQQELQRITEEKLNFEEENSTILVESLSFSYQSMILRSYGVEKVAELGKISEDLKTLSEAYGDLENEVRRLEEKLLVKEIENMALKSLIGELNEKQLELYADNDQLRNQVSGERELLLQKEKELSEFERKLYSEQDLRTELCTTIRYLEKEHADLEVRRAVLEKQIFDLSEYSKFQEKEIVCLQEANGRLESEIGELQVDLEEHKIREVILTSELHERSGEFELWEAEATSFYFDLQISSVREALFENKVYELGSLCEDLEDVNHRRSMEIEMMKMRVGSLESATGVHKSQVTGTLNQTGEKLLPSSVLSELQKLQSRVLEIQNIIVKQKVTKDDHANASARLRDTLKEIEELKAKINTNNEEENHQSARHSVSSDIETKVGTEMKDIPLDQASGQSFHGISHRGSDVSAEQMLELWEAAEHNGARDRLLVDLREQRMSPTEDEIVNQNSLDPSPESHFEKDLGVDTLRLSTNGSIPNKNKRNTRERLASDAQKLSSLLISVHELRRKTQPKKRRKKTKDDEFETFRGQLKEMENSVVQLMDMNTELLRTVEQTSRTMTGRETRDFPEETWKEAEKIGKLELEMQKIQYAFLRMMDAKKNKGKGSVSRSSAAILLRDFFYSRERKSKKPKKSRFCGCLRPSATKT